MSQMDNEANQDMTMTESVADPSIIDSLVADLAKQDGVSPTRAREALVEIGSPAVPALLKLVTNRNKWVRWEAAKTLSQIGDPVAAPAMAAALEDKLFGVRWLAAEALIVMGRQGLPALLQALIEGSESTWLREGAHHVIHDLATEDLRALLAPLLTVMEHPEASVEVPLAAKAVLQVLKGTQP